MANKQYVYSDRVAGVSIQNGMVRIDLAAIAGPAKTNDGTEGLRMDITHQLILPLDAFVAGVKIQQQLVQELVKRQSERAAAAAGAGWPEGTAAAEAPASA